MQNYFTYATNGEFILKIYVHNGDKKLSNDKMGFLINMKYLTIKDAKQKLNLSPIEMRSFFLEMQHRLYCDS